ncbi:MAG: caspase family protein [Rhizobiaceae bacterium]|nr:caspase family protein [Rhizobiaceae bacterium]
MMRILVAVFALLFAATMAVSATERRVALVIGNGAYTGAGQLRNTINDAGAMAEALEALDFEVTLATDIDRRSAIDAIDRFSQSLTGADVAFLFYAGHGMQIGGQNFLLPVDVDITSERALRYSAIDIGEVVDEMERRARVALVVLDACRDNPYVDVIARSVQDDRAARPLRGLSTMQLSGRGAIVAYAAAAGAVASDGSGEHSPYTAALLAEIGQPGVEVGLMFRRAAGRVFESTRGDQRPELLVRLVDEVYLNPAPAIAVAAANVDRAPPAAQQAVEEQPAEVQVAEAEGLTAVRSARAEGFFGNKVIHKPAWAETVAPPADPAVRRADRTAISEVDGNDSYGSAQPVPPGAAVDSRISPRGDRDWYRIEVPIAGRLNLFASRPPENIDLYARVWNADIKVVGDWQGAPREGGALDAAFALPGAGTYWVELADGNNNADSAEPFTLEFDFLPSNDPLEPNDTIGAARPIPLPAEFQPTIFPRGDRDWYRVWVPEPGLLTLLAERVPDNLDVYMRLWDLDGKVVKDWQGPAREGGDTVLEAELAVPGIYAIEMADGNNNAESPDGFSFVAEFTPVEDETEPNESFGQAAHLESSGRHRLAMFPRGDRDWLSLDVDHPGELRMLATGSPENLDIYMRVWDANKEVIRDWIAPLRKGGDTEGFADLPQPGRYFIEIADGNSDASSAQLFEYELAFTPQPDQYEPNDSAGAAAPLTPGGEILFNILPRGDRDWFRLDVPAQGELFVTIDEGPENLDLHYRVWDADRQVVRDWVAPYRKGGLTEGFADLPGAGSYYIEVTDGNNDERSIDHATLKTVFTATGDGFEPNDSFGTASPIPLDTPVGAAILPRGDADWFEVEAARSGEFSVIVDNVDEKLDIYVRLWDADGKASGWVGPPRQGGVTDAVFPVGAAGIYRLEVRDGDNNERSPVRFRLNVQFR